jgi:hypothetical protein
MRLRARIAPRPSLDVTCDTASPKFVDLLDGFRRRMVDSQYAIFDPGRHALRRVERYLESVTRNGYCYLTPYTSISAGRFALAKVDRGFRDSTIQGFRDERFRICDQ